MAGGNPFLRSIVIIYCTIFHVSRQEFALDSFPREYHATSPQTLFIQQRLSSHSLLHHVSITILSFRPEATVIILFYRFYSRPFLRPTLPQPHPWISYEKLPEATTSIFHPINSVSICCVFLYRVAVVYRPVKRCSAMPCNFVPIFWSLRIRIKTEKPA